MTSIPSLNGYHKNNQIDTVNWQLTRPALNREIEGYASKTSVSINESIKFYINTLSKKLYLTVFRMGWYNGLGGRQMTDTITLSGFSQKIPSADKQTGLIECNWIHPYELKTDKTWVSGVYVVKLEELTYNKQSYIIFVVRNDEVKPDILFQLPVTTYQAYNFWGGKCLYEFGEGPLNDWGTAVGKRAYKVSFNRPYARSNNPCAAYGIGAGDFFTNLRPVTTHDYPISSAGWDYNMVRWLEKNNYNVNYCTSIDTHSNLALLKNTRLFISHGHDEYWSGEMRTHVTQALNQGVNLAFISSNTMHWQIRLEKSKITRDENRTIVCYKDAKQDPVKGRFSTINFQNIRTQGSQASLTGVQYFFDPVLGDIKITNPTHWVFKNTGLKNGDILPGLLGYEIDGVVKQSPDNIELLATTPCKPIIKKKSQYIFYTTKSIFATVIKQHIKIDYTRTDLYFKICVICSILCGLTLFTTFYFYMGWVITFLMSLLILFILLTWSIYILFFYTKKSNMTIYQAKSGAWVFATGSMQWAWGLDDFNSPQLRKSRISLQADQITKNLLKEFGAKPQ